MALISSFDLPNTTRRCAGEVELYMWMMTFFAPIKRFDRALDQILARLHEHLEPHVVRRAVFLDEPAVEGELGVRRRGKADLDFLEADFHQRLEQLQFLRRRSSARRAPGCRRANPRCTSAARAVRTRLGHCRSGKWTGGNGRYFFDGSFCMLLGFLIIAVRRCS